MKNVLNYDMIQHASHSTHPLNLYASSYRSLDIGFHIICDECRDIALGFIYLCEECNFKLDVKCVLTGVSQLKEMERVTQLHHFSHPHKLILGNSSDPIDKIRCTICELSILGPAYLCPSSRCSYIIHESCLVLPQKLQVPFHPEHMLVFGFRGRYFEESRCYACRLCFDLLGSNMAYSCDQCQVKLHAICANSLSRPLKYESHSHMHNLYYFGTYCQLLFSRRNPLLPCSKCQEYCEGRPFYSCLHCAVNFHLECVPIPPIVKSRYHIHPLVLKHAFVEDDSGEFYCDVCEEERCQNDHVYCCEECNSLFVAHIECILSKVENVLSYLDPYDRKKSPIIHEIPSSPSESVYSVIADLSDIQGNEEEQSTASEELKEAESTAWEEFKEAESTAGEEVKEEESTILKERKYEEDVQKVMTMTYEELN